jgi:hypothetical protein
MTTAAGRKRFGLRRKGQGQLDSVSNSPPRTPHFGLTVLNQVWRALESACGRVQGQKPTTVSVLHAINGANHCATLPDYGEAPVGSENTYGVPNRHAQNMAPHDYLMINFMYLDHHRASKKIPLTILSQKLFFIFRYGCRSILRPRGLNGLHQASATTANARWIARANSASVKGFSSTTVRRPSFWTANRSPLTNTCGTAPF